MLSNFDAVVKRIPSVLQSPMKPFIKYVETALYPGLTILSWTSLNIDHCKKTKILKPFIFNFIFWTLMSLFKNKNFIALDNKISISLH